jgi:hypothetical protein
MNIEALRQHREHQAVKARLLIPTGRRINALIEEKKRIEDYRRQEREQWEMQQRSRVNELSKKQVEIAAKLYRRGTKASFSVGNTVAYWCFGVQEALGLKQVRGMHEIANEVLLDFPEFSLEDMRGPTRHTAIVNARRAVVFAIRHQCPQLSLPAIGRFMNRDHTSIMNLLGMRRRGA